MGEIGKSYGYNAGKIWKKLNENGPLSQSKLLKQVNLKKDEFFSAIGWLARENKIYKENDLYMIGDTNLTEQIGADAGKIWEVLDTRKKRDISSISRMIKIDKNSCYSALGWLAREGKITVQMTVKKKHY